MAELSPDMSTVHRPSPPPFLRLTGTPSFNPTRIGDPLELHESDVVWSFAASPAPHPRPAPDGDRRRFNPSRSGLSALLCDEGHRLVGRKSTPRVIPQEARREEAPAKLRQSAPVNIPAWTRDPKRLDWTVEDDSGGGEEEEEKEMVPPHVIVARSHVTFSVFEGAGRTLKGRDLRRVRNAVLQKTVDDDRRYFKQQEITMYRHHPDSLLQ
ncbi:hypothetical protein STAS_23795, partial [Striga asiatica]